MPDQKSNPSKEREAEIQPSKSTSERITRELKRLQAEFQKSLAAGDSQSVVKISEQMTLLSKLLQPEYETVGDAEVEPKTNLKQNISNVKAPSAENKALAEGQKKKGGTGFFDLFFNPEKAMERIRKEQGSADETPQRAPETEQISPLASAKKNNLGEGDSSSFLLIELEKAKRRKVEKEQKKSDDLVRARRDEDSATNSKPSVTPAPEQPYTLKTDKESEKSVADLLMDSLETQSKNNLKALLLNDDGSVSAVSDSKESGEGWRYSRAKQLCSSLVLGGVPLRAACLEAFMTLGWEARAAQTDDDLLEIRVSNQVVAIVKLLPRSTEVSKTSLSDVCAIQTQYWQNQSDEPKAIILFGPTSKANLKKQSLVEQSCEEYAVKRSIVLLPLEKLFCISLDLLLNAKDSDALLNSLIAQSGVPSYPALPFEEFPKATDERVAKFAKQLS